MMKMIITIFFVCQISSSIAEMNPQTNSVIFNSQPNLDLNDQEKISCNAMNGQTALYSITIGTNLFRSPLVIYNAFKDAQIILEPIDGGSVKSALTFFIASYEIMLLDSTLIQSGPVGQLISTIYNLNECIHQGFITYETFKFITPNISVNPDCKINPTNRVKLEFFVDNLNLQTQNIEKANFDFSKLVLDTIDCTTGTHEEKVKCAQSSVYISKNNFIFSEVIITIPKEITSQNIYIDKYGVDQNITTTYQFNLIYNIFISIRNNQEECTNKNTIAFTDLAVFLFQNSTTLCDFEGYPRQEFWIAVSELSDNSGRKFQLQFYATDPFNINKNIDCRTWEISQYESKHQCQKLLKEVQNFSSNFSSSIIYKLYDSNDNFEGSFIFYPVTIPGGSADLIIYKTQVCIELLKNLTYERTFSGVKVKLSSSFEKYYQKDIEFQIEDNFIFPSADQTYCFNINKDQQNKLNMIIFQDYFGTVEAVNNILQVNEIESLLQYDIFNQGYIFLVCMAIIMFLWAFSRYKKRVKQLKAQQKIQSTI